MQVIIDRFEGEYAIVEMSSGEMVSIPRILIPNSKEGDVVSIFIDLIETENRKNKIENLMEHVFED